MSFNVKLGSSTAKLPERKSEGAAGYDVFANEECEIAPWSRKCVKTGLFIQIPKDCYCRVAPRSGIALKNSIDVAAGVVDSDYRGEIGVILVNNGCKSFNVHVGDRIAQLILERIITPEITVVGEIEETSRGSGGFGSTGIQ